jgi:hypothetical protein
MGPGRIRDAHDLLGEQDLANAKATLPVVFPPGEEFHDRFSLRLAGRRWPRWCTEV